VNSTAAFNKNISKFLLWGLLAYAVLLNYVVLHSSISFFSVEKVTPLTQAEIIASQQVAPDLLPSSAWQQQTLPDDWYHSERQQNQYWYRLQTELNPTTAPVWAVYLPSVTHNAAVYINGVWVGQGGEFSDPVSRHHNNPLLFDFSHSLLRQGTNQIHLRIKASHPIQGLLDQIYIAPVELLKPAYLWKHLVRVDFIKWVTVGMYFMGIIVFIFWLSRPQDKIYGIFSLQLFIWATHNLNLFVLNIPVSAHLWEAMTMSTLGWTVVLMLLFNHRYVGEKNSYIEKSALILGLLGLGIYFLPTIGAILKIGYGLWDAFLVFFGTYAIIYLLNVFRHRRQMDVYLMLLAGIPILVFGFHDILTVNHFRDRREGLIIQYSVIPAIFLFSWFLVRRFVQSINQAEQLAATLEQRVIDKQQQIAQQYQQVKELEQQQMLAKERERIMRDMHDGIGGQLVSIVASLQDKKDPLFNQIKGRVQQSLTDLRFVIDSLDPLLNDIPTLLGMMRPRLAEQLATANITLKWDVNELPELKEMSPRRSLHIMRIVQEATANVIKHANAKRVIVSTKTNQSSTLMYIDIIDDGRGITTINSMGRGIENMKYRAQQINAEISTDSEKQGTKVRLTIPVEEN